MASFNISTYAELKTIKDALDGDYTLTADIDASASRTENERAGYPGTYDGFPPIGNTSTPFTGTLDGGGYTISNLYINSTLTTDGVGLFGSVLVANGTIHDLTIKDAEIHGTIYIGILAGDLRGTSGNSYTVDNVKVDGTITSSSGATDVGGMVGNSLYADFSDCIASVAITATNPAPSTHGVGGFIGTSAATSTFDTCESGGSITLSGTATVNLFIGGFCGAVIAANCSFQSCISSCSIVSTVVTSGNVSSILGGFVGYDNSSADYDFNLASGLVFSSDTNQVLIGGFGGYVIANLAECAATGKLDAPSFTSADYDCAVGGFIGSVGAATILNCYARGDICKAGVAASTRYHLGGFFGKSAASLSVTKCYSTGFVQSVASQTTEGGFCGERTSGTYTGCFWDTETSNQSTGVGGGGTQIGVTGKTTAQMKTESTFTAAAWDFNAIWDIPTYEQPAVSQSNLTTWVSHTSDYDNFDEGIKDNDAFHVVIPSTNEIRWINHFKSILIGTAGDEWSLRSNKLQTPISPQNRAVEVQSSFGSAKIQSVKINEIILFIDYVRRKVRELAYLGGEEKFSAPDLTALAEHITETGIVDVAYQRNPDSILWCVLTDGTLISLVYDREQNVIAWSEHDTGGTVLSVCVIPSTNEDYVYLAIQRTIDSDTKIYIERMATRIPQDDIDDCYYLDSAIIYDSTATSTITGLDHLEGETVSVLADGVWFDDAVVASGQITLKLNGTTTTASTVQVGLSYDSVLQPMRIVQRSGGGSTMGETTRITDLKVSFMNTEGAYYGSDEDNLFEIDFDDVRLENGSDIDGLFTGDVPLTMPTGFSKENPIIIKNSSPFPMTIRAIIAGFEETGR